MRSYCLFTIEHINARRIYVRGVADITEPVDDYSKIIKFYEGTELQSELPLNPYSRGEKDYELFNELINIIQSNFEEIGDELVFADELEEFNAPEIYSGAKYHLEKEKVII